jgi:hypothetical protein
MAGRAANGGKAPRGNDCAAAANAEDPTRIRRGRFSARSDIAVRTKFTTGALRSTFPDSTASFGCAASIDGIAAGSVTATETGKRDAETEAKGAISRAWKVCSRLGGHGVPVVARELDRSPSVRFLSMW